VKKKFILLLILLIALSISLGFLLYKLTTKKIVSNGQNNPKLPQLTVGSCTFNVDLATTEAQKMQGLSGKKKMAKNSGMMFVYDDPQAYMFWMKDMMFPLDFVWIKDDTIVDLHENVPVPTSENNIARVAPKEPINKVLEINVGMIKECGIKVGDQVMISY
jgi:hypothetical protein